MKTIENLYNQIPIPKTHGRRLISEIKLDYEQARHFKYDPADRIQFKDKRGLRALSTSEIINRILVPPVGTPEDLLGEYELEITEDFMSGSVNLRFYIKETK